MANRPFGVTIVAIIAWLTGAWNIIQGILALVGGIVSLDLASAWVLILIGVITVLVSLGLFRGNNAARFVVALVFAINVGLSIYYLTLGGAVWAATPSIVLGLIGIILLFTPRANRFFRRS